LPSSPQKTGQLSGFFMGERLFGIASILWRYAVKAVGSQNNLGASKLRPCILFTDLLAISKIR
jgi:hypothetical protein